MTRLRMTPLLATLLGATVIAPAAFAQSAEELAGQGQACEALRTLHTEQADILREEWIESTTQAIDASDEQLCLQYYEQASAEIAQVDQGVAGGTEQPQTAQTGAQTGTLGNETTPEAGTETAQAGDMAGTAETESPETATAQVGVGSATDSEIIVTQPEPQIAVTAPPPEVSVTQPAPQVNVNQGTPEVLVRQAPPTVRVEVPPPVITIDQPQPEIIITFPDPEIAVTNPEPRVEVRQAPPTVTVEQAEPQVQVESAEAGTAEQLQVQPQDAQVTVQQEGEAQIEFQRAEPTVTFEQAEPNVVVEQTGEAQVQFTQSGEPNVTVQEFGQGEAAAAGIDDVTDTEATLGTEVAPDVDVEVEGDLETEEVDIE